MKIRNLLTLSVLFAGFVSVSANASVVTFELDQEFSGADSPAGSLPWLTIGLDDGGTAGSVELTFTSNLVGGEFFSGIYLNFDDSLRNLGVAPLNISYVSGNEATSIDQGSNAYKADGDGLYDILFNFATEEKDRFGGADILVYSITGDGITADDFDFLSFPDGGHGPFTAAAHVQGIELPVDGCFDGALTGTCSGWISPSDTVVPVPAAIWLFASGLLGLIGVARRKV